MSSHPQPQPNEAELAILSLVGELSTTRHTLQAALANWSEYRQTNRNLYVLIDVLLLENQRLRQERDTFEHELDMTVRPCSN